LSVRRLLHHGGKHGGRRPVGGLPLHPQQRVLRNATARLHRLTQLVPLGSCGGLAHPVWADAPLLGSRVPSMGCVSRVEVCEQRLDVGDATSVRHDGIPSIRSPFQNAAGANWPEMAVLECVIVMVVPPA
jgi:hypothetical protein